MATADHTAGLVPAVNDLLAGLVVVFAYVVRFGTVAEGVPPGIMLRLTTDVLLPLLGATWLLAVPTYQLLVRIRE